ncbi:MAG: hypothetical protein ACRDJH_13805 [Thermomicrobiales bacterium]
MHEQTSGDGGELSDESVATLARLAGIPIDAERLPAVADTLRTLLARARELDAVDLEEVEPAMGFDASWPERQS